MEIFVPEIPTEVLVVQPNHSVTVPPTAKWADSETVLKDWLRRARESQHTHFEAARHYDQFNSLLSLPVIALTTALGTTAFASIERQVSNKVKIAFGTFSILAAALAAIQAQLKLVERSERHRRVASGYGAVRREIEEALGLPYDGRTPPTELMPKIRAALDHLAADSPDIPRGIWTRALTLAERDRKLSRIKTTEYDESILDRGTAKQ